MSLRADGAYYCDTCGRKLQNGGVHEAAIVSDLDPDAPGTIRVLHMCRAPRKGAASGCVGNVFGSTALADYTAKKGKR